MVVDHMANCCKRPISLNEMVCVSGGEYAGYHIPFSNINVTTSRFCNFRSTKILNDTHFTSFFISRGSVLADIVISVAITASMSKADVITHVVEQLDNAAIKGLDIVNIIILGKHNER